MANIKIENITKFYGKQKVVNGIDLDIAHNEFLVIVGPSGCGKSTTLRMIAGLEEIGGGNIFIGDKLVNHLPPRMRNIAMVFQNYALYPHMTVAENLGFGLKIAKQPKEIIKERIQEAASILGISELLNRKPAELSGGQRQRVAMGRSIVRHPDVFLFDEPLSNLDAKLRVQMRAEIKKLHQKVKTTIIYVTHDQVEAMTLADRIVIMKDGDIIQLGTPLDLYNKPVNKFVATFIGSPPMNMINCLVENQHLVFGENIKIPLPPKFKNINFTNQQVILGIRSDHISPVGHEWKSDNNFIFPWKVDFSESLGEQTILNINIDGQEVLSKMFNPIHVKPDSEMNFSINLDKIHLFDSKSEENLSIDSE